MAGIEVTKDGINHAVGVASIQLRTTVRNFDAIRDKLSTMTQQELEALGFSADDAYLLKFFFEGEANDLHAFYAAKEANLKKFMGIQVDG